MCPGAGRITGRNPLFSSSFGNSRWILSHLLAEGLEHMQRAHRASDGAQPRTLRPCVTHLEPIVMEDTIDQLLEITGVIGCYQLEPSPDHHGCNEPPANRCRQIPDVIDWYHQSKTTDRFLHEVVSQRGG